MKHQPNPEEPDRCLASDLLVTDCSGCRGSDESFVDALLRTEPELEADYEKADPLDRPVDLNPLDYANRGLHGQKWWLDTGRPTVLAASSNAFRSHYSGTLCQARCGESISSGQLIVHTNAGGYAHLSCLEAQ